MSSNLETITERLKNAYISAKMSKKNNGKAIAFQCMQWGTVLHIIEISDNKYQIVEYKNDKIYVIEVQYLLSYNSDGSTNVINTFNAEDIVNEAIQRAIYYEDS
jgi:hypothetical protein